MAHKHISRRTFEVNSKYGKIVERMLEQFEEVKDPKLEELSIIDKRG